MPRSSMAGHFGMTRCATKRSTAIAPDTSHRLRRSGNISMLLASSVIVTMFYIYTIPSPILVRPGHGKAPPKMQYQYTSCLPLDHHYKSYPIPSKSISLVYPHTLQKLLICCVYIIIYFSSQENRCIVKRIHPDFD